MIRTALVILVSVVLIGPASAQDQPAQPATPGRAEPGAPQGFPPAPPPLPPHLRNSPTPKSPAPGMALASWNGGRIYLRSVLPFPKQPPAPNAAGANGGAPGGELASVAQAFDGRGVQAKTADGKSVRPEDLSQRLATETPVLVGFAALPADPTYLRVVKEDTLLLLLPAPPMPTAPAPPRPNAPSGRPAPPADRPEGL